MQQLLGQVMVDVKGLYLTQEEKKYLQHPHVGGVILFARNYDNPEQLQILTSEIKALRQPELLIAVDQEGGRIQRFQKGFTTLPSARELGEIYDKDKPQGLNHSFSIGKTMASELRALGVDLSFAPVLDLDYSLSTVITNRSFHKDKQAVTELAGAYIQGMQQAGMCACGKHFPGHGGVIADSHLELPIDNREYETLLNHDMHPFKTLINNKLDSIMVAHVVYEKIDSMPAGFSKHWIQKVLREELAFQGLVFSDDLSMKATAHYGDYIQRAHLALKAGCEMILVCNNPEAALQVLHSLDNHTVSPEISEKINQIKNYTQ